MSYNYFISPGSLLKEYIFSNGFSQKDFANKIGLSERRLSNIINDKAKIDIDLALKFETIFKDVKAEFWIQANAQYYLFLERNHIEIGEEELRNVSKIYQFDFVFKGMKITQNEKARRMLSLLQAHTFSEANQMASNLSYSFMEDGGKKEAILVWTKMSEHEMESQNDLNKLTKEKLKHFFDNSVLELQFLKKLLLTEDYSLAEKNIRRFLEINGIGLVLQDAVPSSKVRGATKMFDEVPYIFLSSRYKRLDIFYFAFLHEIFHILDGISGKEENSYFFDFEGIEDEINDKTRDFFVDKKEYSTFLKGEISEYSIREFSQMQKVIPSVILGFLTHDKVCTDIDYARFNDLFIHL